MQKFEIDAYGGQDAKGRCADWGDWLGVKLGYSAYYPGFGEVMLYEYGSGFYPAFLASLSAPISSGSQCMSSKRTSAEEALWWV